MNKLFVNRLYLSARVLVAITFLVAGIHKIVFWQGPAMWMASKGLPAVNFLLGIATVTELLAAVLLVAGYKLKWVSIGLFIFLLSTTVLMHTFWNMDGMMFQTALLDFIQNIAILGGLLAIAALASLSEQNSLPSHGREA